MVFNVSGLTIFIILLFKRVNIYIHIGQASASDFTKHKNEEREQRYIKRQEKNEDWGKSGIDTAGFWTRWLLRNKPTIKESYQDIKKRFIT